MDGGPALRTNGCDFGPGATRRHRVPLPGGLQAVRHPHSKPHPAWRRQEVSRSVGAPPRQTVRATTPESRRCQPVRRSPGDMLPSAGGAGPGSPESQLAHEVIEVLLINVVIASGIDIRPALLGGLPKGGNLCSVLVHLSLQQAESFAQYFTGVLIAPRCHQFLNEFMLVLTQDDVSCGHFHHLYWQFMPTAVQRLGTAARGSPAPRGRQPPGRWTRPLAERRPRW